MHTYQAGLRVDSNITHVTVGITGHTVYNGMVLKIEEGP